MAADQTLVGKGATGTAGAAMSKADAGRQVDQMSKVQGMDPKLGTGGEATLTGGGGAAKKAVDVSDAPAPAAVSAAVRLSLPAQTAT